MISQAAADESLVFVYFMLAAASAGVFLHAGIKFPWFVFFQKDSGLRPKDAPWNMAAAMVLLSALCILLGVFPDLLYKFLPYPVEYVPYTAGKVLFYLQLLLFSGLAFFLLLPLMKRTRTVSLDTDWVWRVLLYRAADSLHSGVAALGDATRARIGPVFGALRSRAEAHFSTRLTERAGVFARAWSIGTTALWIAILLTAYVLVYVI
jgi:multicomponent Na+:H+ antiporter subunit D